MKMQGSLFNRMNDGIETQEPYVGMGATQMCYTDRHAYTVVEVKSRCRVVVKRDIATRIDDNGMSDCQTYKYEPNPDAYPVELIKTKKGWKELGHDQPFALGFREEYYDYSF